MTNLEQAIENLKANTHSWKVEVENKKVKILSKVYKDKTVMNWHPIIILRGGFIITYSSTCVDSEYLTLINEVLKAQKEVK